jgi:hypothetical protein
MLCAGPALGQDGGHIGIFSDNPGFSDCGLVETLGVLNSVYVVHQMRTDAGTSQFKVDNNWPTAVPGGELYGGNLFIGSTPGNSIYEGGSITYGGCKPLPRLLVTLQFFLTQPSPICTYTLWVVPDPTLASGQIEVVDCVGSVLFASAFGLTINTHPSICPVVMCFDAVEETSWSRVKALYQ